MSVQASPLEQLDLLIRARTPIIWVPTQEEERLENLVRSAARRLQDRLVMRWDFIGGLDAPSNRVGTADRNPLAALEGLSTMAAGRGAILLLLDFHRFLEDAAVNRRLRNLARELRRQPHTVVISAPNLSLPTELETVVSVLELPLPGGAEIRALLEGIANAAGQPLPFEVSETLSRCCTGLPEERVRQVAARALAQRGALGLDDQADILEEKRQAVRRTELLEYCSTATSTTDIGGHDKLKRWLEQRRLAFSPAARAYGLPHPKGVLLLGPQGTGKSLTARAVAHSWGMPLLRLDVGRLFAGLVGASEARTREMIRTTEAMAPCVLWIDEMDKGFGSDSRSDGGASQRVLATMLTWMAEKESPVFVMATANGIDALPAELLRKGRFDEIFLLDLPTLDERKDILRLHLIRLRPSQQGLDLDTLAERCQGFSGAELEQVLIESMHLAFGDGGRPLQQDDLLQAAAQLVPLSRTAAEQLQALQQWAASGRARPASSAASWALDG